MTTDDGQVFFRAIKISPGGDAPQYVFCLENESRLPPWRPSETASPGRAAVCLYRRLKVRCARVRRTADGIRYSCTRLFPIRVPEGDGPKRGEIDARNH